MLLLITNKLDTHPNLVIEKLNKRGVPFFRLNTDMLLRDYDILYEISDEKTEFEIKYKNGSHAISSKEISCIWERRPMEPLYTFRKFQDESVEKILLEEADGFLQYFRKALDSLNVLWIGHPINERRAQSKILQKIVAKEIGFHIPYTVFTNEYSFLSNIQNKTVAIKPISSDHIDYDEKGDLIFYTRKVTTKQLQELGKDSFENNINFIEEYAEKSFEIRVTVVKDECFAARIDSQKQKEEEGAVDWRQGYDYGLKFSKMELPNDIKTKCIKYLKVFQLNFGCFDFIVNNVGDYIFLECNTNGQWVWIEEETGLQISEKLADVFTEETQRFNAG